MAKESRLPFAALGFAIAAALSSWTPLAAPFGAIVGAGALVLSARALRRRTRPRTAVSAAVIAALAVAASVLVLARTAGVGRELGGTSVVNTPGPGEVGSQLDAAAERTRQARDRARSELDNLGPPASGRGEERKGGGDAGRDKEPHR